MTLVAVLLDLIEELGLRGRSGATARVLRLHDHSEADAAVLRLRQAGIEARLRGGYHRALLHYFGPFVLIEVLVPAAEQGRAAELLHGRDQACWETGASHGPFR